MFGIGTLRERDCFIFLWTLTQKGFVVMSTCGWGTINAVWQWVQLFLFTQPVRFVLLKCCGHSQQALFCFLI